MRGVRAAAVAVVGLLGVGLAGGVASASINDDPGDAGFWYMTTTGVEQVHASGVTGEGITIAVLDGPINPELAELVGANLEVSEDSFCDENGDGVVESAVATDGRAEHASHMAALIVGTGAPTEGHAGVKGVAPGATVRHYAIESDWDADLEMCEADGRMSAITALEQALDDGADIVSMSFAGNLWPSEADEVVARAVREGVILLGASRSLGGDYLGTPADFNGAIGVEAANSAGERTATAVVSEDLDVVAPGEGFLVHDFDEATGTWTEYSARSGSSSATAYTAGVLALAWSAHPEATGNQMIQALVRMTTQNAGELRRIDDAWGYGMVNVNNLMLADPTDYPDENPLVSDDPLSSPTIGEIFPEGTAVPTPTDEPTDETPAAPEDPALDASDGGGTGIAPMLVVGGGVLALLVIALVVVVIARNRRSTPGPVAAGWPTPGGPPAPPPHSPGPPPPPGPYRP